MIKLNKKDSKQVDGETLYRVICNGDETEAYASENCYFSNDVIVSGGHFRGGTFHGGTFHGGVFHGGTFHGGVFRGGTFHGGTFHGGHFHGGTFHGGTFHGGEWRQSPLFIQGSVHPVTLVEDNQVYIGCEKHHINHWMVNYRKIGRKNRYSEEQIAEYYKYIKLIKEVTDEH